MIKWADEIEVGDIISYDGHGCKVKRLRRVADYIYYIGEDREGIEVAGSVPFHRAIEVSRDWSKDG